MPNEKGLSLHKACFVSEAEMSAWAVFPLPAPRDSPSTAALLPGRAVSPAFLPYAA